MSPASDRITNFIAGSWRPGRDRLDIFNPSNLDELAGSYSLAGADDVAEAVAAARGAQPQWRAATVEQRSLVLDSISRALFDRKDELALIAATEGGKTIPDALGEITRAAHLARFFAAEALRAPGET
ncbi:aldehyde dehydrogenase family protein, partial [Azospirillum brasilense]